LWTAPNPQDKRHARRLGDREQLINVLNKQAHEHKLLTGKRMQPYVMTIPRADPSKYVE
jgi:hypothetical protein